MGKVSHRRKGEGTASSKQYVSIFNDTFQAHIFFTVQDIRSNKPDGLPLFTLNKLCLTNRETKTVLGSEHSR